ncbi:MAG: hypothetical protein HLUCCA12_09315 [Rhodobacteraceae bacterium HLUCCA12]|nr:MAG: hypothetical protein HLUCCA12_09315 [Rhodobacteraceae bacterium HLUCCA12]
MGFINRIDRHADLLKRMAETVQADLGAALESGSLSGEDLRRAMFTCVGCNHAAECPGWMDAHGDGAAAAPGYCRNRGWLARLRSEHAAQH